MSEKKCKCNQEKQIKCPECGCEIHIVKKANETNPEKKKMNLNDALNINNNFNLNE